MFHKWLANAECVLSYCLMGFRYMCLEITASLSNIEQCRKFYIGQTDHNSKTNISKNTINRKRKGKTHQKMKRSPDESTHKHMETLYISVITDAFFNQKRVNVCEHAVKMASHGCFWKLPSGSCETGNREGWRVGKKIKWRLSEVNTRAMSRGQNKLIGKFKMAADD